MSTLDRLDNLKSMDPQSMHLLLESFPEQIQAAAQAGTSVSLPQPREIKVLVVAGLGGSAIGADVARVVAGPQLGVPLIVNRDYSMPGFVDASSLVFASSYSGNTEETLSAYQQARSVKASLVCITSGGKLEAMAKADSVPVLRLPAGLPPRAAFGHSLVMLLVGMQKMQIIPDTSESTREAVEVLNRLRRKCSAANPEAENAAKSLARSLAGKLIAIYGSSAIMDAVAYRWRSQIEENAKNLAFHHSLPEMNHNELVGWRCPEDMLRRVGVIFLRDKGDHPQTQRRFDLTRELIAEHAGTIHEVWSEGNSLLARVLSSIYLGDFVSLYLAYLNYVDPTPVQVIDYLKKRLDTNG
jgi:glucose/mannose-6-phosphate isomerase